MTLPSLCCSRPSRAVLIALIIAIATAVSAQPAERTFTVDVTGSGPDIILIPGLAGGGAVWDGTVARLASSHTLHVVTLAGFGGVAPVDASTQDGFLDIVRDELVAYVTSLDDPAIVAGHSLGGWTALRIGLAAPESIAQVVVVDALPFLAAAQDPTMTEARAAQMGAGMKQMMSLSPPDQFRVQQEMALAAMITDPDTAAAYLDVHASSDPATVAQAMYDMFTTDLRGDMAELMVPTLVLAAGAGYGGMDEAAVRALYEGQYGDGIRVEVVPESRHFIQLDQPDALAEHLRAGTGVTLDPSRLFMGTLEMNYAILQGTSRQPVGTATETFEMDGEALRWMLLQRTPQGEMVDTLWMHPETLAPQRYRSQNPLPQTVRLDYGDAHVTGTILRGDAETPIDTELADGILDASAVGSLVPALTLAEGFETTLATFHYASGSSERSVRVVARETLSTVNGNREAWVVDETLATPRGQTLQPRTWVDAETGVRWKTEVEVGPGMIYEAVVRSVQPAR